MPDKKFGKSKNKASPAATRRKRANPPNRRASRIPGVDVGEVVGTSLGPKKKVCFNIGGRWYFRMVDPDWKAPGRPKRSRGQRSEDGKQRAGFAPEEKGRRS